MKKAESLWREELSEKKPGTRRLYDTYLNRFLEWANSAFERELDHQSLYELYRDSLRSGEPQDGNLVERKVKKYLKEMEELGASGSACRLTYYAIRLFFNCNGLKNFEIKSSKRPRVATLGQGYAETNHILMFYNNVPWEFQKRNKAIILFLKDSGVRVSDLAALSVKDYEEADREYNDKGEPFLVFQPFRTVKSGLWALIHIGPEAVNDLDDYISEREREEGKPLDPGAPLFLGRGGIRLSSNSVTAIFNRLKRKIGKDVKRVSAHSLRKFHTTKWQGKINSAWICKLQGKAINGSIEPYTRPEETTERALTKAYIEHYDVLRIFGKTEAEKRRDQEIERLKKRVNELEKKLVTAKTIAEEIEKIGEDLPFDPDPISEYTKERLDKLIKDEQNQILIYETTLEMVRGNRTLPPNMMAGRINAFKLLIEGSEEMIEQYKEELKKREEEP